MMARVSSVIARAALPSASGSWRSSSRASTPSPASSSAAGPSAETRLTASDPIEKVGDDFAVLGGRATLNPSAKKETPS
jgi:hypothetical protein